MRFICDAMLGGLARWLRAAGQPAAFDVHIADGELVPRALTEDRCLLTSDSGVLDRYALTEGLVRWVFVPRGMRPAEQLAHVIARVGIGLGRPLCMVCGAELADAAPAEVAGGVPERVRARQRAFLRLHGLRARVLARLALGADPQEVGGGGGPGRSTVDPGPGGRRRRRAGQRHLRLPGRWGIMPARCGRLSCGCPPAASGRFCSRVSTAP